MSWKDDMIELMRKEGAVNNPKGLFLATMTGGRSCRISDGIELAAEDLYISERLLSPVAVKVNVVGEDNTDRSTYLPALKAGDEVLLYRLNETKFVIIEKVVSA